MNTIQQSPDFRDWFEKLKEKDRQASQRILREIVKMQGGLLGDWKPLGDKVAEKRIDYGPGYRLYYSQIGSTILLVLVGGTKKTQAADIRQAKRLAKEWFDTNGGEDGDGGRRKSQKKPK